MLHNHLFSVFINFGSIGLLKTPDYPKASAPPTSDRVTLKEIAEITGVSVSTVSAVLANKANERRISEEVVGRVREVARQRDYAPNLLVRSLRKSRTYVLSFYDTNKLRNLNDLLMDRLLAAVEREAGRLGYDLLIHCDHSRPAEETYRMLNGGRADGLLVFGPQNNNDLLPFLRTSRLPTVILNRQDEAGILSSVSPDIPDGMRQVADRLIALGHRRIGAVGYTPLASSPTPGRIEILGAYLAEHGVTLQHFVDDRRSEYDLCGAVRKLLSPPDPITALFCENDRCGYEVLQICSEEGIAVPSQLSVVGYDGLHWPSTSPHVLVSVIVPLEEIAEIAVHTLNRLVREPGIGPIYTVLPVTLGEGTTLAPPPTL